MESEVHEDFGVLSVVLLEPSQTQAKFITKALTDHGINIIKQVSKGQDAIDTLLRDHDDVLISCMYLPDMNAIDVITIVRGTPTLEETSFILISSETKISVLDPIKQSGVSAMLPKPFTEKQLRMALAATKSYISPENRDRIIAFEELRVLLVDDSSAARRFVRRVLEQQGFVEFTECSNGLEAVGYLNNQFYDLVVTDYNMPEMDGRQLTEYIRTQSWQSSVPILMVSSESNESRLAAVEQAGISAICDKPFTPDSMRQLIMSLLMEG